MTTPKTMDDLARKYVKPPPEHIRALVQERAFLVELEARCRADADTHWRRIREIDQTLNREGDGEAVPGGEG